MKNSYTKNLTKEKSFEEDLDFEEETQIPIKSNEYLFQKRLIPLGKILQTGRPYFYPYPKITDATYNVYSFVSPMGSGKTLLQSSNILTKEYGVITAIKMYQLFHQGRRIYVLSYQDKSKSTWSQITDAMYSGEKELYEVIAEGGSRVKVSMDHIMLVWRDGMKSVRLKDVTTDDWVLFPKKIDSPEWKDTEKEDNARMCGIFLADGNSNQNQIQITNNKFREFLITYCAQHSIKYSENYYNNCYHYSLYGQNRRKLQGLMGITEDYCISSNKTVPSWIFTNKAYMRTFIQGLMECDGSFLTLKQGKDRKGNQKPGKKHQIELTMNNRQLVNSVALMLLSFGIRSNYRTKMSRATNSDMKSKEYYCITISGNDNLKKYLENIPPYTEFQKERLKDWNISAKHNSNMRYNLDSWMDKATKALLNLKIAGEYWDYTHKKQLPSDNHRFRDLLDKLDKGGYEDLANEARVIIDNYYMAKIKSIESIGIEKAYDFEVKAQNFLAGDGCGMFIHNSTNVRNFIYFLTNMDKSINIIFDPMKMEFAKLAIKSEDPKKKEYLLNEVLIDPETDKPAHLIVRPDSLKIFHIIPRFALIKSIWDQETKTYRKGYDHTTISIMKKDGGHVFAEDMAALTSEQLFNALNYRDLRSEQSTHFYIRAAYRICNRKYGNKNWFVDEFLKVLREGVKQFRGLEDIDDYDMAMRDDDKGGLSSTELQLIENIEKYKDAEFFILNEAERKKYSVDWRKFIRLGRTLNITYSGYKKTEKIGVDIVVGQTDLILERLIEISNEYYEGVRKREQSYPTTPWEDYLFENWKVNLYFEESEIFIPRDVAQTQIKKVPCLRRLDYLMSFGRKYGFRNFMYVTQRIGKVHPIIFKESNNIFLGPLIGEDRDQILSDFGVSKLKFKTVNPDGSVRALAVRDVVTTLNKEKHQWLFISKATKSIAAIQTYDSPCG